MARRGIKVTLELSGLRGKRRWVKNSLRKLVRGVPEIDLGNLITVARAAVRSGIQQIALLSKGMQKEGRGITRVQKVQRGCCPVTISLRNVGCKDKAGEGGQKGLHYGVVLFTSDAQTRPAGARFRIAAQTLGKCCASVRWSSGGEAKGPFGSKVRKDGEPRGASSGQRVYRVFRSRGQRGHVTRFWCGTDGARVIRSENLRKAGPESEGRGGPIDAEWPGPTQVRWYEDSDREGKGPTRSCKHSVMSFVEAQYGAWESRDWMTIISKAAARNTKYQSNKDGGPGGRKRFPETAPLNAVGRISGREWPEKLARGLRSGHT